MEALGLQLPTRSEGPKYPIFEAFWVPKKPTANGIGVRKTSNIGYSDPLGRSEGEPADRAWRGVLWRMFRSVHSALTGLKKIRLICPTSTLYSKSSADDYPQLCNIYIYIYIHIYVYIPEGPNTKSLRN